MVARRLSHTPYVLLIEDLWPDSVFATGFLTDGMRHRLAATCLNWFAGKAYNGASRIAVTSPGMRAALVDRGVAAEKISIVYNWVDEKVMHPAEPDPAWRTQLGLRDEFVLMYAGNHGPAQALDVAVRAMTELLDLPDVHLVLVGSGIDKPALKSVAEQLRLRSVHFLDPVDEEVMPAMMASADLMLVSLADEGLFRITVPSKVQSILACGCPVLSCAPGDAARMVDEAGAGLTCPPGDPVALARAVRRAHDMPRERLRAMGRAARAYYESTLSEAINARTLANLLRAAAGERNGGNRGDLLRDRRVTQPPARKPYGTSTDRTGVDELRAQWYGDSR
jgi:glycosyltransferase involved in cell wall biosynthesis